MYQNGSLFRLGVRFTLKLFPPSSPLKALCCFHILGPPAADVLRVRRHQRPFAPITFWPATGPNSAGHAHLAYGRSRTHAGVYARVKRYPKRYLIVLIFKALVVQRLLSMLYTTCSPSARSLLDAPSQKYSGRSLYLVLCVGARVAYPAFPCFTSRVFSLAHWSAGTQK